jgi:hypothetical protein
MARHIGTQYVPGPSGPPGYFKYFAPIMGPGAFALPTFSAAKQGVNTSHGPVSLTTNPAANVGDTYLIYDTGGYWQQNPVTLTDPNEYPFQDPQSQGGLVLVPKLVLQADQSICITLTDDPYSGIYWAIT